MFNPHNNVTADGVLITMGLKVFTNELEVGTVLKDDNNREFGCCQPTGEAGSDQTLNEAYKFCLLTEEQFEHLANGRGQVRLDNGWFTNHSYHCDLSPYVCDHDHWFTIATKNGTKSFNGERIATVFEGRKA